MFCSIVVLYLKNVGSKQMFDPKGFWSTKMLVKKVWVKNNSGSQTILGSKNWVNKMLGPNEMLGQQNVGSNKFWGPKQVYSLTMYHPVSSDIQSPCKRNCQVSQGWGAFICTKYERCPLCCFREYQVSKLIVPGGWWCWRWPWFGGKIIPLCVQLERVW